jgi:hypothetical protein
MRIHEQNRHFEGYNVLSAANNGASGTFRIAKVQREFPSDMSALSNAQIEALIDQQVDDTRLLNKLFHNVFAEVLDRCRSLGLEYIRFRPVSIIALPEDGCSIALFVTFSSQGMLQLNPADPSKVVRKVKDSFQDILKEIKAIYVELGVVIRAQEQRGECYCVVLRKDHKNGEFFDDAVMVSSERLSTFISKSLRHQELLRGMLIVIGEEKHTMEPDDFLVLAQLAGPAPSRVEVYIEGCVVWGYKSGKGSAHYLTVEGEKVGVKRKMIDVQIDDHSVFTGTFKNCAKKTANVKDMQQMIGKKADMIIRHSFHWISTETSSPLHTMVEAIPTVSKYKSNVKSGLPDLVTQIDVLVDSNR